MNKKPFCFFGGIGLVISLMATPGMATTLDFEGVASFTQIPTPSSGDITPTAGSVLTNEFMGDGVIFGKAGVSAGVAVVRDGLAPSSGLNSIAGLDNVGNIPGTTEGAAVGDIYFSFVEPGTTNPSVTNFLSFTIGDAGGDLDVFTISLFDAFGGLINSSMVSGNSRLSVMRSFSGIHSVVIDFNEPFGYSLDDLTFNTPAPIPEPSTIFLFGTGLAGLACWRSRKRLNN